MSVTHITPFVDPSEGHGWERFQLICKPEQSGKTFLMIKDIISDYENDEQGHSVVNFIFCDNNLLLTKQTTKRISSETQIDSIVDGHNYVEFSSRKSKTASKDRFSVLGKIMAGARNIVCCTNGRRIADIQKLVEILVATMRNELVFKIWLDEADKFTKAIGKTFRPLADKFENVFVNCITATPEAIFSKYKHIKVLPLEITTSPMYHGWGDNHLKIMPAQSTTREFVEEVLETIHSQGKPPAAGTKWFVPAESTKKSHRLIRDALIARGFAVFVVNGDGLSLTIPTYDRPEYVEKKTKLLNQHIKDMLSVYDCSAFPIAVTGNICIGRGISIMDPEFMFDFGIMSFCAKKAEVSQTAGRLKGNIKSWPGYKPPTVYTTAKFNSIATEWEEKSRRLAVLAYEQQQAGESTVVTKSGFKTLGANYKYVIHPELFENMAQCRKFLETVYKKMHLPKAPRPHAIKKKNRELCDGYAVSTKLVLKKELSAEKRLTIEMANHIGAGTCVSNELKKGARYLCLPVYESLDTPADQEKYQVRYICYND